MSSHKPLTKALKCFHVSLNLFGFLMIRYDWDKHRFIKSTPYARLYTLLIVTYYAVLYPIARDIFLGNIFERVMSNPIINSFFSTNKVTNWCAIAAYAAQLALEPKLIDHLNRLARILLDDAIASVSINYRRIGLFIAARVLMVSVTFSTLVVKSFGIMKATAWINVLASVLIFSPFISAMLVLNMFYVLFLLLTHQFQRILSEMERLKQALTVTHHRSVLRFDRACVGLEAIIDSYEESNKLMAIFNLATSGIVMGMFGSLLFSGISVVSMDYVITHILAINYSFASIIHQWFQKVPPYVKEPLS
jgi:7tm Chemosensory receptor